MTKKPVSKASRKTTAKGGAAARRRDQESLAELPDSDPQQKPFTPKVLDRTAIAIPLLEELIKEEEAIKKKPGTKRKHYPVIIDLHLEFPGGRDAARERVKLLVRQIIDTQQTSWKIDPSQQGINESKSQLSEQYLFGVLEGRVIRELIKRDCRTRRRGSFTRFRKAGDLSHLAGFSGQGVAAQVDQHGQGGRGAQFLLDHG